MEISIRHDRLARGASILFFVAVHLAALGVAWTGVDRVSLTLCAALYALRVFGVTAGYHRYFSHRAFETSRAFRFALALLGATAGQKGPLWWAGVHRDHHQSSDGPKDPHSPRRAGLYHAHLGWIFEPSHGATDLARVKDFARYPEIVLLDRHHYLAPAVVAIASYALGGARGLVVGFCLSTVLVYHAILSLGSLLHSPRFGTRRYPTSDDSRNHWLLALATLGDGWHNNHHHDPSASRHGCGRWEIDLNHCALRALAAAGLVWSLREPAQRSGAPRVNMRARRALGLGRSRRGVMIG